MMAWIHRFVRNIKSSSGNKQRGELTTNDVDEAEMFIFKLAQKECLSGENDKNLNGLNPFLDDNGILRMKSRNCNREDVLNFRFPIILMCKHAVVTNLIFEKHV